MTVFLFSGASGAGKTTLTDAVKSRAKNLESINDDALGIPTNTAERQMRLEEMVKMALEHQLDGKDTILDTNAPLGELLAVPMAPGIEHICAALIDVDDRTRRVRLRERGWNETYTKQFLVWADWQRHHAADPRFRPEVITDGCWNEMRWERWLGRTSQQLGWNVLVVDTSRTSVAKASRTLHKWIESARHDLAMH